MVAKIVGTNEGDAIVGGGEEDEIVRINVGGLLKFSGLGLKEELGQSVLG